jgi:hypothetical protein
MGFFSLFRKGRPIVDGEGYARPAAGGEEDTVAADQETDQGIDQASDQLSAQLSSQPGAHQRDLARAVVLKIDAIEAAMAADMFDEPAFRRPPRRAATVPAAALPEGPPTELMDDETPTGTGLAPAVGEAALLYANGYPEEACRVLAAAVAIGPATDRTPWWMLLDLYLLLGRQEAFESLAIDYASVFEAPPPAWYSVPPEDEVSGGLVRTVALAGVLDARAAAHVGRLAAPPEGTALLRLDVSRITGVEPEGCALLHDALLHVPPDMPMALAGAEQLLARARAIVDVGRRDTGAAPWLLILELLRLCDRRREFNEAGMDYGVTFDLPPPLFAPPGKVSCVPGEPAGPGADRYLLPRRIAGDEARLWPLIRAYAEHSPAPVLDGSRLAWIDDAAAGHLLALLRELADRGHRVELRELNHMVAALLAQRGCAGTARLLPRRW